ncbi:hypothetical protein PCAR4_310001 [Paraburkholderia caribensis]|nr:hypothetical protein PCAR4_310001 [Paraburkholderia caribensis]
MKRQEGELGKCHARDYSGNAGNVQLGALRAGLFGVWVWGGWVLSATLGWFACVFAGIRVLLLVC